MRRNAKIYLILFSKKLFIRFQVSFFSTSPELSNKQRFEYFTRTIPSDHYQVKAMVEIVMKMKWSYVSIIYEESNYGIKVSLYIKFNITLLTWQNQQIKKLRNREIKFSRVYVMYFYFQKKKILVLFSAVRINTKKNRFKHFIVEINILRIILLYFLIFLPFYQIIDT